MEGLQRTIEDPQRVRLHNEFLQSHVGSGSFVTVGTAGLTTSAFTTVASAEWFSTPPVPLIPVNYSTGAFVSGYRSRELEWRRTHATALVEEFQNQWVVLEGEQIVAHGSDPVEVINEAKSKGIRTPYIFFVEPNENVIRIGL